MELIDKDALVAEIEKTINEPYPKHDQQCDWEDGYCSGLYKALSIIEDTIEVKEVDLDNNIRAYLTNHFNVYEDGVLQSKKSSQPLSTYDIIKVAEHFFELGLKAVQKGE